MDLIRQLRTPRSDADGRLGVPGWIDPTLVVVFVAFAATAWLGTKASFYFNWDDEAQPSVNALLGGHVGTFFRLAPPYGPSLLLRAPFMAATRLLGGGSMAVYRAGAFPCLAAAAALAVWLGAQMKQRGCGFVARALMVAICVLNPLAISALVQGHPEEILGAALCVTAILCAQREHPIWSGILVGLATANKEWGLLAIGPVLVALPRGRRQATGAMLVTGGLLYAPFLLVDHSTFAGQAKGLALHSSTIFQPLQLWWFIGSPAQYGNRVGRAWLQPVGHTLPIAIMVPLTLAYAARTRRWAARRRGDAMLLLALLLLLRCALDPWDVLYYPLPLLIALLAWETTVFDRLPVISVTATIITWVLFLEAQQSLGLSLDACAAVFAALTVPAIGAAGARLLADPSVHRRAL
jgi:hypothetical protein